MVLEHLQIDIKLTCGRGILLYYKKSYFSKSYVNVNKAVLFVYLR
jgi:hypothetical protein